MDLYFDKAGQPLTLNEFLAVLAVTDQVVASTALGAVTVTTIWTGVNMQHRPQGVPLIFETTVLGGGFQSSYRYPNEAEARAGHDRAVRNVAEALPYAVRHHYRIQWVTP